MSKELTKEQFEQVDRAVAGLARDNGIEIRAEAGEFSTQRRGTIQPGDSTPGFGLYNNSINQNGYLSNGDGIYTNLLFNFGITDNYCGQYGGLFGGAQGSYVAFSHNTRLAHQKMALCVSAYKGFGVAKNVIDLMANFASEGLKINHENKTVQKFYQGWAQHVDLQGRVKDILRYYYKYANVFIYTTYGVIEKQVYDKMRRSKAILNSNGELRGFKPLKSTADTNDPNEESRLKDAEQEAQKELDKRSIPWRYTLLNPFQMELRGSKYFGGTRWVFLLDENTVNALRGEDTYHRYSTYDFLDESNINLPPEFQKLLNRKSPEALKQEYQDGRVVELDQDKLFTLHYMKDDHEDWADPLLWPVMNDIFYKNRLRQMDMSVANSVINAVTIFKLGNFAEGYIPPVEHLRAFQEMLRTPTQAMTMVWNDAIDVVDSYPPVDKILSIGKYESVDKDILRGIGIPDVLLGGGGGEANFSTGFLGVRTLLERLEEGRETVMMWLNKQLEIIAETMGHRTMPKVSFGKMSLRDEQAEKQLILGLLDRGILSVEAVLEAFGEDFEIELQRLRDEQKIRESEGLLEQHGPFTNKMATMTDEEIMNEEQKIEKTKLVSKPNQKPGVMRPNGRPDNSGGIKQTKKRVTKPRGMAWIVDFERTKQKALKHLESIEVIVARSILKATGKVTKRSLSKKESQAIEDITFALATHLPLGEELNDDVVHDALKVCHKVDAEIYETYNCLVNKDSTLEQRRELMASAIASIIEEEEE